MAQSLPVSTRSARYVSVFGGLDTGCRLCWGVGDGAGALRWGSSPGHRLQARDVMHERDVTALEPDEVGVLAPYLSDGVQW